jgi:hypothetical protein
MRGDVSIIDGKLCYEFEISQEWRSKLTEQFKFYKYGDEWKVYKIEGNVAFCYAVNPKFNREVLRLTNIIRQLNNRCNVLDEKFDRVFTEREIWNRLSIWEKIKVKINHLVGKNIFRVGIWANVGYY